MPLGQAAADDLRLTGFPSLVLSGLAADAQQLPMRGPFDNTIKADTLDIVLEKTTLDEVVAQFGGTIHNRGNDAAPVSWLCYEVKIGDRYNRQWFISDGRGAEGKGVLTTIAGDEGDAAQSGCEVGPETLSHWTLPVPSLDGGEKDLVATFGAATSDGIIRYTHNVQPDADGKGKLQSLVYRLKDGQIDGVALSQYTLR
ncbi:hypothetical protein [Neomesorhizobium albiziae]|uniref:hypothetical protein n=1 Tax=Neomesorhizobium albiziae TaxID=335020 RepID=UPI00122C551C|nr:hypothetical protein [Mesorhizobium albiziae]